MQAASRQPTLSAEGQNPARPGSDGTQSPCPKERQISGGAVQDNRLRLKGGKGMMERTEVRQIKRT